jgi:hypothetical protein
MIGDNDTMIAMVNSLFVVTNDDKIKCSLSVPISAPNVSVDEELTTEDEEEHYLIMDRRSPAAQQCSTTEETEPKKTRKSRCNIFLHCARLNCRLHRLLDENKTERKTS